MQIFITELKYNLKYALCVKAAVLYSSVGWNPPKKAPFDKHWSSMELKALKSCSPAATRIVIAEFLV